MDSPISHQPKRIPYHFAKKNGLVVRDRGDQAGAELFYLPICSLEAMAEVKRVLNKPLILKEVDHQQFQDYLAEAYQSDASISDAAVGMGEDLDLSNLAEQLPSAEDLLDTQDDAPIIRLINALFSQAIKQKASDIHIETYEDKVLVRNRIDGVLQEILEIQRVIAPLVISRIKVMAKLDIAEKRIPQDGRISLKIGGHNIDVRVSTLPSNHGERVVLRILDQQSAQLDLNLLGMSSASLLKIRRLIAQPHGIILVTGPTGSGKTTSLYAMLTELNQVSRNILTIEDPIEYDLPGIGQTQVNSKVDMTFAKGLRAILRQDPDSVMIGEIRDLETADIAVQASLTGHLVLSTLHTNSALGAITRLQDMGVESFLISSSIIGLLAQRLVRLLCPKCKEPQVIRPDEAALMGKTEKEETIIYQPKGCEHCHFQGYHGRTGIYELIPIDDNLRKMIHQQDSYSALQDYLGSKIVSIREDGFQRVLQGDTSIAEILRVTAD